MNNKNIFFFSLGLAMLLLGCKKYKHEPLYGDSDTPQPLENVSVENLSGSARITYTLPDDQNVLYILADYEMRKGVSRQVKASYYDNKLLVEGFGDTLAHEVTLTVVSKTEQKSTPVKVTVNPLTPPVTLVYRSLKVLNDFGGINIDYKNVEEASVVLITSTNDSLNQYGPVDYTYTTADSGNYSLRGYDSTERKFGICVKDKWGNVSDTLTGMYKPLYEVFFDKSLFSEYKLPGDADPATDWGDMSLHRLWDGSFGGWDIWHSEPGWGLPMIVTFDMGVTGQIGRITMWPRQDDDSYLYAQNNVRVFEIYGSDAPNPSGELDGSWTLLVHHEVIKPSGTPVGTITQADRDAAKKGEEMRIPLDKPRVRYIRIKMLEVWEAGGNTANIAEISLWGTP